MDWPGMLELDWYVRGNTAQALVEPFLGIVQHIEVRRDGVEVTWVFSRSLPGHGDLVIEAEVPGADLVTADEPGPGRGGRLPRATVGKAFAVDARGSELAAPPAAGR